MYILLFLIMCTHARTIYKVLEDGQCNQLAGHPITDKTNCEDQSLALGWSDNTAVSSSFSSYLPQGCILKVESQELRLYTKETSVQCSSDYKCLCEITAPDCSQGLNRGACLCSNNICTRDTGLECALGQCSHARRCSEGLNNDVCHCGARDCTPDVGLMCLSGQCSHADICPNRQGGDPNSETCQCGTKDCYGDLVYCYSESSSCISACPGGTYVNHLLRCLPCNVKGYYCPGGATSGPTSFECPPGRYGDIAGLTSVSDCGVCAAGRYSAIAGITSAEHCTGLCPAGKFSEGSGLSSIDQCKGQCSAGKYSYETGLTSDDECKGRCSAGKYSSLSGIASDCQGLCPRGKYGLAKGAISEESACIDCPIGHKCDDTAIVTPKKCPIGSYQSLIGQDICSFCPVNTYSDISGAVSCTECPVNNEGIALKTTGQGSNSKSQCQIIQKTCPNGQRPISDHCENCPMGFFSNGKGSRCILCPSGFYQSEESQMDCNVADGATILGAVQAFPISLIFSELKTTKIHTDVQEDPFPVGIVIVYSSLLGAIVIVLGTHRCWPKCFKSADLIFSGDHIIEDTHARRILKTRLGAAFTISMPFVIAIVAVFVFTSDNQLTQNGLVPIAVESIPSSQGLFQKIRATIHLQGAGSQSHDQIQITTDLNIRKCPVKNVWS